MRKSARRSQTGDGEPWVWRYKDLTGWWQNDHHNRIGGPARWRRKPREVPGKPSRFWFTEFGCAAIDKGTNQPNKISGPQVIGESAAFLFQRQPDEFQCRCSICGRSIATLPRRGRTRDPALPPITGPMLDMGAGAMSGAGDARPYPFFPGNAALWSDGDNLHARALAERAGGLSRTLAGVVAEICANAGVTAVDVSRPVTAWCAAMRWTTSALPGRNCSLCC